jgi:Holliday junction DNA helicase RuvA
MIGFIRGQLISNQAPTLLIDVNGVGYELEAPLSTCLELPPVGSEVQLTTHLLVREDQHTLYGFASESERQLFRDLLKVNRVGARLALGILSSMSVGTFAACVQSEDVTALAKLPGVGKKTAERLIMDMRDRVAAETLTPAAASAAAAAGPAGAARHDAYNALLGLGYKPAEARAMLDRADSGLVTTEAILRSVLQSAAPDR